MNKKSVFNCASRNIYFGIVTIVATFTFMMQICNALLTIEGGGILNYVHYTLFVISISITRDTYSQVYNIVNYPLIPILIGIIYNVYIIIKNNKNKEKVNS